MIALSVLPSWAFEPSDILPTLFHVNACRFPPRKRVLTGTSILPPSRRRDRCHGMATPMTLSIVFGFSDRQKVCHSGMEALGHERCGRCQSLAFVNEMELLYRQDFASVSINPRITYTMPPSDGGHGTCDLVSGRTRGKCHMLPKRASVYEQGRNWYETV